MRQRAEKRVGGEERETFLMFPFVVFVSFPSASVFLCAEMRAAARIYPRQDDTTKILLLFRRRGKKRKGNKTVLISPPSLCCT